MHLTHTVKRKTRSTWVTWVLVVHFSSLASLMYLIDEFEDFFWLVFHVFFLFFITHRLILRFLSIFFTHYIYFFYCYIKKNILDLLQWLFYSFLASRSPLYEHLQTPNFAVLHLIISCKFAYRDFSTYYSWTNILKLANLKYKVNFQFNSYFQLGLAWTKTQLYI